MSVRYEWMHLPNVEYVPPGYDVSESEVLPEEDWSDETTAEDGALLVSADECTVITGDPQQLADWAVRALEAVRTGADDPMTNHLYEKCLVCHLFVEANAAYAAYPAGGIGITGIARYMHLCNDDYPEDEALDASHEPQPSGVRLPLAVWRVYGSAHLRARFDREKGS